MGIKVRHDLPGLATAAAAYAGGLGDFNKWAAEYGLKSRALSVQEKSAKEERALREKMAKEARGVRTEEAQKQRDEARRTARKQHERLQTRADIQNEALAERQAEAERIQGRQREAEMGRRKTAEVDKLDDAKKRRKAEMEKRMEAVRKWRQDGEINDEELSRSMAEIAGDYPGLAHLAGVEASKEFTSPGGTRYSYGQDGQKIADPVQMIDDAKELKAEQEKTKRTKAKLDNDTRTTVAGITARTKALAEQEKKAADDREWIVDRAANLREVHEASAEGGTPKEARDFFQQAIADKRTLDEELARDVTARAPAQAGVIEQEDMEAVMERRGLPGSQRTQVRETVAAYVRRINSSRDPEYRKRMRQELKEELRFLGLDEKRPGHAYVRSSLAGGR